MRSRNKGREWGVWAHALLLLILVIWAPSLWDGAAYIQGRLSQVLFIPERPVHACASGIRALLIQSGRQLGLTVKVYNLEVVFHFPWSFRFPCSLTTSCLRISLSILNVLQPGSSSLCQSPFLSSHTTSHLDCLNYFPRACLPSALSPASPVTAPRGVSNVVFLCLSSAVNQFFLWHKDL